MLEMNSGEKTEVAKIIQIKYTKQNVSWSWYMHKDNLYFCLAGSVLFKCSGLSI